MRPSDHDCRPLGAARAAVAATRPTHRGRRTAGHAFDAGEVLRPGAPFGPLLEGFVLMELARQLTWSDERAELFHYRTRDKVDVDAVLENRRGQVVGVEVKAASTVRTEDFRGPRHLADRLGDDFEVGVVLYTGDQTLPFGPRLRAVPVSALWEASV